MGCQRCAAGRVSFKLATRNRDASGPPDSADTSCSSSRELFECCAVGVPDTGIVPSGIAQSNTTVLNQLACWRCQDPSRRSESVSPAREIRIVVTIKKLLHAPRSGQHEIENGTRGTPVEVPGGIVSTHTAGEHSARAIAARWRSPGERSRGVWLSRCAGKPREHRTCVLVGNLALLRRIRSGIATLPGVLLKR